MKPERITTMKKNAQYEIKDEISTIIVTKRFKREASVMDTPEFEEYMRLKEKFPTFKIVIREIKKNSDKETYRNLTYVNMENLITEVYRGDEKTRKAKIAEYWSVRSISKIQPSPYAYVKAWFLEEYNEEYNKYRKDKENQENEAESSVQEIPTETVEVA